MENIKRNNLFLTELGLASVQTPDALPLPSVAQRHVKIPKRQVPKAHQLALVGTTFTDDQDQTMSYRVVDVKFSSDHDQVCCFCIAYSDAAKDANEDDLVFDCDYVRENCDSTAELDEGEGDADDD